MQDEMIASTVRECVPDERAWLRSALLTDQGGFLTATRQRLARLARARGIAPDSIDDVVQETLFEAWHHLERLHSPAGIHLWIDEICRNVCRRSDHRRNMDNRRNKSLFQSDFAAAYEKSTEATNYLAADVPDPLEALNQQDLIFLLDRALSMLPPATRQVIEMCYLLELPHTEIAARLNLSSGTLDVRLHRARRCLRQILNGPLRGESESLGLRLDEDLADGWQPTRIWCPLCGHQRLEGCFLMRETEAGPNLHMRCPHCARRYNQDTVHSMGLVQLTGLHAFRPAWKRTMLGLSNRIMEALQQSQRLCLYCGKSALLCVEGDNELHPYTFWIHLSCVHCGTHLNSASNLPSVDQMVYWSHPISQQFLLDHPRWTSKPARLIEYEGVSALHFQIADLEGSKHLNVIAHRQTLRILAIA